MNEEVSKKPKTLLDEIGQYWNERIHDLEIVEHPVGSLGFFEDLDGYRFEKLHYLPRLVDFAGFGNKKLLEIGCGAGIDLVRFAEGDAQVTGIDLSSTAIELAYENFRLRELKGDLRVMNGEAMEFPDATFDIVYVHGVIQYTADAQKMVDEAHRVLKPGGQLIGMVYNRKGWLNWMSKLFRVGLEHEDAPVLRKYTMKEFRQLLRGFTDVRLIPERFPVRSRLHKGLKGLLYNTFFVGLFNLIPRPWVRRTGWHIMAFATK